MNFWRHYARFLGQNPWRWILDRDDDSRRYDDNDDGKVSAHWNVQNFVEPLCFYLKCRCGSWTTEAGGCEARRAAEEREDHQAAERPEESRQYLLHELRPTEFQGEYIPQATFFHLVLYGSWVLLLQIVPSLSGSRCFRLFRNSRTVYSAYDKKVRQLTRIRRWRWLWKASTRC